MRSVMKLAPPFWIYDLRWLVPWTVEDVTGACHCDVAGVVCHAGCDRSTADEAFSMIVMMREIGDLLHIFAS